MGINMLNYLQTDRLLIRSFSINDIDACYQSWGQDKLLGQYIAGYPMTDRCQMELLVQGFLSDQDAWVLEDKKQGTIIGYITIDVPYRQLNIGEIGYVIGKKYQNHGYASEAVNRILAEYFINQGFYLIEAKCNEMNHASLKLLHKTGFQIDGKLRGRRVDLLTGERNDLIIASVTQTEFMNQRNLNQ